jgi:hypothetical protein
MKRSAALFPIALALGEITLAPWASAQAQGSREEGPIEIEKCRTIDQPGSYKLVNNLTGHFDANGNCLVITAGFVTIDLSGFLISGGFTGTGILAAAGAGGIVVRNGSISGFDTGVDAGGSSIVEALRVVGNVFENDPASFGIKSGGIVKDNFVTGTGMAGISATGTVTGNVSSGNFHDGILVGPGSTVIGNTVDGNGRMGLVVTCPSNVTNNTAINNFESFNLNLLGDGCNNTNNVAP